MGKIQRLTPEIVGKIAAGEVVERPAAAIKEMLENSMDAGATAITVEIRDGGISYFRVTDNGSGIPHDQVRMAFERHATSKIDKEEDLYAIATLGFRGEALASIAAVSQVTCSTRTQGEDYGIKLVNHGGQVVKIEEAPIPEGTTFVVENLFYNTPVRLKFLKKPAYEAGLVSDFVMRLILSRPDIAFRFVNQGKTVYHSPGDGKVDSAIYSIYGREMLDSMRYVKGMKNGMLIEGYIGIGDSARGNRNHQSFFINGRYMKNNLLSQGVEQGARERVTIGRFPTCVLYITLPYDKVDVNVHPNKLEVRFQNEMAIFEGMRDLIHEALKEDTPLSNIPQMSLTEEKTKEGFAPFHQVEVAPVKAQPGEEIEKNKEPFHQEEAPVDRVKSPDESTTSEKTEKEKLLEAFSQIGQTMARPKAPGTLTFRESPYSPQAPAYQPLPKEENNQRINIQAPAPLARQQREPVLPAKEDLLSEEQIPPLKKQQEKMNLGEGEQIEAQAPLSLQLKVLGVVFSTYILVEYKDQLLLIDQHAAHERLLYDQFMKALDHHQGSQQLLVPQVIPLTFTEKATLTIYEDALRQVGFEFENFGDSTIQLRALPVILGEPQAKSFFLDMLDEMENLKSLNTVEKRRGAIIQMSCKRAVKGGENLPMAEIESIIEQMVTGGVTPTCPHGRPLVVGISQKELEKRFKRIQ